MVQVILENAYSTPWSSQRRSELSEHQRSGLDQLEALADCDGNGALGHEERQRGDAVALLKRAGPPPSLTDDTEDGSRGSGPGAP